MKQPGFVRRALQRTRTTLSEIGRRRVIPVAAAYFVAAWLLIEVAATILPVFEAPDYLLRIIIILAFAGFPVALMLSWIFDITPRGVVRTEDLDAQAADSDDAEAPAEASDEGVSERRQITVLYGTLAAGRSDGRHADPEDLRSLLADMEQLCTSVAGRFEGHVCPGTPDRLVVYFGYPQAGEEDARRAVRAGLALLDGLTRLSHTGSGGATLTVKARIGVDTGTALVEREPGETEPRVLGAVVQNAEWLQSRAPAGGLAAGAATAQLVDGFFQVQALDLPDADAGEAQSAILILAESGARNRLEARGEALAPPSGRDQEIAMLARCWQLAAEGEGQIALVSGEAGMGKSLLAQTLRKRVAEDPSAWLTECYCSPQHRNDFLYPVRAVLEPPDHTGSRSRETSARLRELEGLVVQFGMDPAEAVPLLAALLDIDPAEHYPALQMAPARQREKTLALLTRLLLARAATQPLLLMVEDLHWADASFMELMQRLVEAGPAERVLILATSRPSCTPAWASRGDVTRLTLTPLTGGETRNLVSGVCGNRVLPAAVVDNVVAQAQGNPFFAEELARYLLAARDSGDAATESAETGIPATLQESLLARLDRLGDARNVARLAATFGRGVRYALLKALADSLEMTDLDRKLDVLVQEQILYRQGVPPEAGFRFRHVLIQEAAYRSLLRSERERYHAGIADILQATFPAMVRSRPQMLAEHLALAGRIEDAIPVWLQAGKQALRVSANEEAGELLRQGLKLLARLPSSPQRDAMELDLQTALGPALMARKGYSAPEVDQVYQRAAELCDAAEATPRIAPVLFGLWTYSVVSGALPRALQLGDRLQDIARSTGNVDLLLESHVLLGVTRAATGPVDTAIDELRAAIAIYEPEKHSGHAFIYGQDPLMAARVYLGTCLWWQGRADDAREAVNDAVEYARGLGHPHSLAFALSIGARCHLRRGDDALAQAMAREAIQVAQRHGFPVWEAVGRMVETAAGWRIGKDEAQLLDLSISLEQCKRTGNSLSTLYYSTIVADAMTRAGRFEDAGRYVDEAFGIMALHESDVDEAELYRTRGCLLWQQAQRAGDPSGERRDDAESWLRKAESCACKSGAASWQLAAALSLATFLGESGRSGEAVEILARAVDAIDQGYDLPGWQQASALLTSLKEQTAGAA